MTSQDKLGEEWGLPEFPRHIDEESEHKHIKLRCIQPLTPAMHLRPPLRAVRLSHFCLFNPCRVAQQIGRHVLHLLNDARS